MICQAYFTIFTLMNVFLEEHKTEFNYFSFSAFLLSTSDGVSFFGEEIIYLNILEKTRDENLKMH